MSRKVAVGVVMAVFELPKISWGVENSVSRPDTYEVKMQTAI